MTESVKPKKRVNSKSKGNRFERNVVELLDAKFSPLHFRRSSQSGAILGGKNVMHLHRYSTNIADQYTGDIVCINGVFGYSLECKSYKEPDSLNKILQNTSRINTWFSQCFTDSAKTGKKPLLIFTYNHHPIYSATFKSNLSSIPTNHFVVKLEDHKDDVIVSLVDEILNRLIEPIVEVHEVAS